jgi:transposase
MSRKKLGWEDVSPEDVVLAERNLEVYRVRMMALSCEHCHGVVENIASTLNTLV